MKNDKGSREFNAGALSRSGVIPALSRHVFVFSAITSPGGLLFGYYIGMVSGAPFFF